MRALPRLLLAGLLLIAGQAGAAVRPSALAGSWYPADAAVLQRLLDGWLEAAATTDGPGQPPVRALVLPHAGYRYSGATAARGVALVRGRHFRRVVILAPSHRAGFDGLSIAGVDAYRTPLGEVPLDGEAVRRLRRDPLVGSHAAAHRREHSIEIELPLLQRALAPGWRLLPLLVGRLQREDYPRLARLLRPLLDDDTLLIVSSDFTHYGEAFGYQPFPLDERTPERIRALDEGAVAKILARDLDGFLDYRRRTGDTICGYRPIGLLLALLPADARVEQIAWANSGSMTGDYGHAVSYVVLAVRSPRPFAGDADDRLSEGEMALLQRIAEAGIRQAVAGVDDADLRLPEELEAALTPALKRPGGAFVTLKEAGHLRGCIGYIAPVAPLYRAVLENGYNAARRDYRFQPLQPGELKGLEVEVSVLTPPRPIDSWRDFRVGEQGIILSKDGRRAVFLPEVAREQGWDREQTLTHLARKAGLPGDAWRQGARFQVFRSQVHSATLGDRS
ncbi:MAG TPA: AmmeMemoRadiSam system protein B [Sedimenticola thiotaurini]|uniref:MEMO1 family protein ENI96_12335 n=1 Tax=Sedimenticola thiotaurini TaxID=1543721 RepID=A0A831RQ88_9GAMM|nr:AmmeMemoRadiSam system protein B [Sedimenticola thiotaurini]